MPARAVIVEGLQTEISGVTTSEYRGQTRVVVPKDALYAALTYLRDTQGFDLLVDVTCVDYLNYRDARDRFGLVYCLVNTEQNDRLIVRVMLNEPDLTVPSAFPLWETADWLEREVFDMFGITFSDHPDLRRILMPTEFTAHPLRKDYPLQGRGERHNFPILSRGDEV